MARDSIEVDKLLKLKPQPTDLFYPTLPTYEEKFEGETEDEARDREQRNERRRVDFENGCKVIERKGALVDRIPWDEADTKVESLIYLSLGAEARRNYHQKNPHTQIEKCTTHELVHELNITFTIPRNTTFDRFKFFKSMQQSYESLETFYSRIREAGALCKPMPERKNPQFRQDYRKNIQQQRSPQKRRVRHVKEQEKCVEEEETEEETVNAEPALYIKELKEDWSSVNTIRPVELKKINSISFNKEAGGECWVKTKCNNIVMDWLADTGSTRSLMEHAKAKEITNKNKASRITTFDEKSRYKCFNSQDIKISGVLHITLKSGAWTANNCSILLVKHLPQPVMGRDILQQLGIYLTATKPTGKTIGLISDASTEQSILKWIFKNYPHLCTRLGRSKNHMAKSTFKEKFIPTQHKGRRVPLHLLERVEQELEKLIEDKQIMRLEKCSDEYVISPVVITVKKDKSVKIALDTKERNDAIHKNKYQMQSFDHLIDALANYVSKRSTEQGTFFFSKIDLKYAYSQIPIDPQLQKHCNFNILGGKATGTYRLLNGFYGLTDMPATFQKTIDVTLRKCHNKFAFLDDILVITKGKITDHEKELVKILYLLVKENLAIKLQKCKFAKKQITWLG